MGNWDPVQVVLSVQTLPKRVEWIVQNTLIIPPTLAAILLLVPIVHAIANALLSRPNSETDDDHDAPPKSLTEVALHHGGWPRFVFLLLRVVGCLALVSVSAFSLQTCFVSEDAAADRLYRCTTAWLTLTYAYSAILAVASLFTTAWASRAEAYNNVLLFGTFAVFAYRDLWPLATYTLRPQDEGEGPLLWFKISTLFVTAVVLPIFAPRQYVPFNPKEPMLEMNDELTCSWFERVFFMYLDKVVWLASRVPHLALEQMPPLVDTYYSANLEKKSLAFVDPLARPQKRHVFFGWVRVFWKQFFFMGLSLVGVGLSAFVAPLAIFRILSYLENGPGHDYIRPWFWVVFMFTGALTRSLCYYNYNYHGNTITVQSESLLTQLIFQHSLRIRATAGDAADDKESEATPSNADSAAEGVPVEGAATPDSETAGKPVESELSKKQKNLFGKITNLVTRDVNTIGQSKEAMFLIVEVPLQITLAVIFLYQILGWSSLIGFGATLLLLPVPGYAAALLHNIQQKQMELSDARVQKVTEVLSVIRMVKLFGWQERMAAEIKEARKNELSAIFKYKVLDLCTGVVNHFIPSFTMVVTYATYTGIMKQQLTPSVIFASLTVFDRLRSQLWNFQTFIGTATRGKVSLDRLNDFLTNTELLDPYISSTDALAMNESPVVTSDPTMPIGFKRSTFSWSIAHADPAKSRTRRAFKLQILDELIFKPDCINLITGPTGSGKTAILMALLGEMHYVPHGPDSWANLPRTNGIAYAAQESWVQNETIRQNILFDQPYDETRYNKVIHQCALTEDLSLFEAGDQTEVGEKGITLSGGQKARVTLARAVYSSAQILLLDDIFAALDVHTSRWIVDTCLKGELVKGRTVLLVTHNTALALPIAQQVVSIDVSGKLTVQDGSHVDMSLLPEAVAAEADPAAADSKDESPENDVAGGGGKLVVAEEVAIGHVSWKAIKLFLTAIAGNYPFVFFTVSIFGFVLSEVFFVSQKWFLGFWGSQYENHDVSEISVSFYLGLYTAIVLVAVLVDTSSNSFYAFGSMRASKTINELLTTSVLTSTLRWLDETPVSRIIARCTNDMGTVDNLLADGVSTLGVMTIALLTEMGIVVLFAPLFVLPALAIGAIGLYVGQLYLKAQLSAQRERSNASAPVIAHVTASISGIVSIRAYGAEAFSKAESYARIDRNSRTRCVINGLFRWMGVRIDLLGNLYLTGLACYLIYGPYIGASNTGFTLNVATDFSMLLLQWLTFFNSLEVQANSLERIQGFLDIDHEPLSKPSGIPPASWPTSGDLRIESLSARYSKSGPKVLHDISFHVQSGERIGIVGRTGSGKSSLTLALLRGIITDGTVLFDGRRTDELNLDVLRTNITIIPQTPELMSGTLRKNLDPFDQYDDATLNNALKDVGLYSLQEELGEKKLTLDSDISAGGANVSVGERQIIALARALIRRSRILILDEATSAIDYKTDARIQETLRHRLPADVTVLTVAHRLQSIMDADKIMVLDAGRIVEYDSPSALLQTPNGKFKALVDGSGDKSALYERNAASRTLE